MEKFIVTSIRENAGKTSMIVGMACTMKTKKIGYMKPFGDRLLYRKKRLWDYDSALVTEILGLKEKPENMSLGYVHPKLRSMYGEEGTKKKLIEMLAELGGDKDITFVEGGKVLAYGASIHLDALTMARHLHGELVIVVSGNEDTILDDVYYIKKYIDMSEQHFRGVIINKVHDIDDFTSTYMENITKLDINVLGIVPYREELTDYTIGHLSERLFAKVIAGERGLENVVKNVFVGAMTTNAAVRQVAFSREKKAVITGGDRNDMILAALESDTAGIILTNNILPPSYIISKASERNIPLLLLFSDTYETAKRIDHFIPLLRKDDSEKITLLEELVRTHVTL